MTAVENADEAQRYDPRDIQDKWQTHWAAVEPFRASDDPADPRERFFLVDMFPYPSGDLHMGHAEAYAIGDAMARYWFLRGKNVMHPIGWDAFGLPAENAAIRNNAHPIDWTYKNIETQAASFRRYATSFDWSRRLQTCDPEYYRWNQWLFLRFFERGLAYRKGGHVNWCPKDQTVLANEQVVNGRCERCGTEVVRRVLTQWYFKITEYADRLLADAAALEGNWPDRVLTMQRNWIGRSTGADVQFEVEGRSRAGHGLHHAARHAVRRDVLRRRRGLAAGRRPVHRFPAGRVRGVPGAGAEADRHRAAGDRPGEDRRVPGRARGQPGERRAHPGLGGRLRAARLRHRRDHGGARARPARPGLRPAVRPAGAGGGRHRRRRPGGHRGRGAGQRRPGQLRPAGRAVQGRGDLRGLSRSCRRRAWAPRR